MVVWKASVRASRLGRRWRRRLRGSITSTSGGGEESDMMGGKVCEVERGRGRGDEGVDG